MIYVITICPITIDVGSIIYVDIISFLIYEIMLLPTTLTTFGGSMAKISLILMKSTQKSMYKRVVPLHFHQFVAGNTIFFHLYITMVTLWSLICCVGFPFPSYGFSCTYFVFSTNQNWKPSSYYNCCLLWHFGRWFEFACRRHTTNKVWQNVGDDGWEVSRGAKSFCLSSLVTEY